MNLHLRPVEAPEVIPERLVDMPAHMYLQQFVRAFKRTAGALSIVAEGTGFPARIAAQEMARCDEAADALMAFCDEQRKVAYRRSEP